MSEPKVYTIAPGLPFVDALAAGLRTRCGDAPDALADVRVFLPTRRACRALALAFVRCAGGRPLLLPRMTPLGDIDDDDLAPEDLDALDDVGAADIPPAIPALRRQLLLTRQVGRVLGGRTSPAQAAQLAAELARLFDQVHIERLDLADLGRLVPDDLARHWQVTLGFLQPLATLWHETLAAEGCIDPAERRNRLMAAQLDAWRHAPPTTPVIAAGSTGSIPITAELLSEVARLPQGVTVLPGLDLDSDEVVWRAVCPEPDDPDFALACSHPQFGLAQLLRRIGVARADVRPWPAPGVAATHPARAALVGRALAPAACAEAMRTAPPPAADAIEGMTSLEAAGPEEEARSIALILREVLEQPDRTAALVTPDRTLARRVAAELDRWGVAVDDSAGRPLAQTPPGAFLRLVARMVVEAFAPVPLLAVLQHPLAACGRPPADLRRAVRILEPAVLRGVRPAPGIDGLRRALAEASRERPHLQARLEPLLDALEAATRPLAALVDKPTASLAALLDAHVEAAQALAATDVEGGEARLWAGDDGEQLALFVDDLALAARGLWPIAPGDYPELLDVLLAGRAVRPRWGRHPRLAIWGPLEARMQRADVMILGGLSEDVWPPAVRPSPWMSRPMMQAFGLPLPERRIGLSAHDFCQAFSAPTLWLTRARRRDGAPTVPCRWLLRIEAALHGSGWREASLQRAGRILHWQRLLDAPGAAEPALRPEPRPPVAARPRRLSVTRIETWIRDPYALYAHSILRLRPLQPLDAEPEAADFGSLVHAALHRFVADHPDRLPADAEARLLDCGRECFGELLRRPTVGAFWWPRFERIARWFVAVEHRRHPDLAGCATEIAGAMQIEAPAGPFTLTAKADRIDRRRDGRLVVVDYKTGKPPAKKDVAGGLAPQLPLEAAIAEAGGFEALAAAEVATLEYWRLSGDPIGGEICTVATAEDGVVARAVAGLTELVAAFDDPDTPYPAQPRPAIAPGRNDYEHLERVKEWSLGEEAAE